MSAPLDVSSLIDRYPLPDGWSAPEVFVDVASVHGLRIELTGMVSRSSARPGLDACGSAAGSSAGTTHERAYFELLERIAILDAIAAERAAWPVCDEAGRVIAEARHAEVFPEAPIGASWAFAKSNGVAARDTFANAARVAVEELVERDCVLRSWFGEALPEPIADGDLGELRRVSSLYDFETYAFPSRGPSGRRPALTAAAIFGFPKAATLPLIRGSAAAPDCQSAVRRAAGECLQSLGFLWGEPIPEEEPEFSTTPAFHQEYYLWSPAQPRLRAWLRGDHAARGSVLHRSRAVGYPQGFVDLTPGHLAEQFSIVKALPGAELPLIFGKGHPHVQSPAAELLGVHPLA